MDNSQLQRVLDHDYNTKNFKQQLTIEDIYIIPNDSEIKNEKHQINVLASFEVSEGAYFYEVQLLQGTEIQIGWVNKLFYFIFFEHGCGVDETNSVLYATSNAVAGDIFGCFLHIEEKIINFYRNGQLIAETKYDQNIFKNAPIYAITLVATENAIRINFGHKEFKCLPHAINFYKTFHSETRKQNVSFNDPQIENHKKWFCKGKFLSRDIKLKIFDYKHNNFLTELLFNDDLQPQFDITVTEIEEMINNGSDYNKINNFVEDFLKKLILFDKKDYRLRFIQSIFEKTGKNIKNNKINTLDYCICSGCGIKYFSNVAFFKFSFTFSKISINEIFQRESIHKLFAHYISKFLKLDINEFKNQRKTHYICLMFVFCLEPCCNYIHKQLELFLNHVFYHSTDPWSQLYSFIALKQYYGESKFKKHLLKAEIKSNKPSFFIWKTKISQNELENTRVSEKSAQLQLYLYLNYYLTETKTNQQNDFAKYFIFQKKMFFGHKFIFSSSNLMVRCESGNTHFMDFYYNRLLHLNTLFYKLFISSPTFYFEVTIITVGKMRIGLAVKQMDVKNIVGDNDLSIGIDGLHQCVWMHKKKYNFKTSRPLWNAGDVIGVYVDFVNRLVVFGINNKIIDLEDDPFEEEFIFSILPCRVAVSLSQYQQCSFNLDCKVIPQAFLNKSGTPSPNFQNITNSVLTLSSTATFGNVNQSATNLGYQLNQMQNLSFDRQLSYIMKSDEATDRSLSLWKTVTEEIDLAYGRVISENYKSDKKINLDICAQWFYQMESLFTDIRNRDQYYHPFMKKIGEINKKLNENAQDKNNVLTCNQPHLMLMPAPNQLEQGFLTFILSKFKITFCDTAEMIFQIVMHLFILLILLLLYIFVYNFFI